MIDYRCFLEPGRFYHIYNRGVNGTNLFYNRGNYEFFLHRYASHLSPLVETYAYCLLPNHFHLLVRIREKTDRDVPHLENVEHIPTREIHTSDAFRHFFTSYSKSINAEQKRHGSLFEKPFRRKLISDTSYLTNLVFYIHANPQLHHISNDFRKYSWSSYERMLRNQPSKLEKVQVLQWFDSAENYVAFHDQKIETAIAHELMFE